MRDFEDSTLWRISAFERVRLNSGTNGFERHEGGSVLSSTLLADLGRYDPSFDSLDPLELVAACMRNREPALIYLQHHGLVWPVTLFPEAVLYHSPRDFVESAISGLGELTHLGMDPPGVWPPGHYLVERVGRHEHYRPLSPLLWQLAINGPRRTLLREIGGTAAYRLMSGRLPGDLPVSGALGPALARLRQQAVSLREMSTWPGLSVERASRLLNALYLFSGLIITRSAGAARGEPTSDRGRFGLPWLRR